MCAAPAKIPCRSVVTTISRAFWSGVSVTAVASRSASASIGDCIMNVVHDLVASRFERQLLGGERAGDAVAVAERLLAVQAQDLRSARLAVRARARGASLAGLDRALTSERSLVIGWLNRGTLHLVRVEDYPWLHALTTPPLFTGNARRLAQTGVSPRAAEMGVATVERALSAEGPLTRDELRDRLAEAKVPTSGQALVHVLMLACLRGV